MEVLQWFFTAFVCLQFGLEIFWQMEIGTKAALIILLKLTPVVNYFHQCPSAKQMQL